MNQKFSLFYLFFVLTLAISCQNQDKSFSTLRISENMIFDTTKYRNINYSLRNYLKLYDSLEILSNCKSYESLNEIGFFKIGYLLNPKNRNAIIINSTGTYYSDVSILEFTNNAWNKIFSEDSIEACFYETPKFEDFNFDGVKDLLILNSVSNGSATKYYNLFLNLSEQNTFKYIAEFTVIGNPVTVNSNKTIKSISWCCVGTTIWEEYYKWIGSELTCLSKIQIDNTFGDFKSYKEIYNRINGSDSLIKRTDYKSNQKEMDKLFDELNKYY